MSRHLPWIHVELVPLFLQVRNLRRFVRDFCVGMSLRPEYAEHIAMAAAELLEVAAKGASAQWARFDRSGDKRSYSTPCQRRIRAVGPLRSATARDVHRGQRHQRRDAQAKRDAASDRVGSQPRRSPRRLRAQLGQGQHRRDRHLGTVPTSTRSRRRAGAHSDGRRGLSDHPRPGLILRGGLSPSKRTSVRRCYGAAGAASGLSLGGLVDAGASGFGSDGIEGSAPPSGLMVSG